MHRISRRNLQKYCRGCLSSLSGVTKEDPKYDLAQNEKVLRIFTSLNTSSNEDDDYPQKLCQLCYDKLHNFEEFRRLIQESAQKIDLILGTSAPRLNASSKTTLIIEKDNNNDCLDDEDDDFDDKLLIPELAADWNPLNVKTELEEFNESKERTNPKQWNDIPVKNEIDSEYDQDSSICQFYEQNALNLCASLKDLKSGGTKTSRKRDRNKKCLKCPRCDKQVYKKVYLDAHIRAIHEGHEKPFLCSECQKSFTRYNQLHVHMQTNHKVATKFVCGVPGCSATFKRNTTLETHRRVVHTEESPGAPFELGEIIAMHQQQLVEEWEMEHFCIQCGKKYSSKRALSEHLKRHSNIKDHVCRVCGAAKVTRTELLTHMRTHDSNLEKFKCKLCPQEFNHKNAISRHIRVVHEGERRFKCSYCIRRFGTRHAQTSHERLHTGERPFKCDFCPKGFAQIEGFKSHMKSHDKSLRKHVCKFCSQRCLTRKNLVDHEQRHLGNKPHICKICSRGFFNRKDLNLHKKIHDEENAHGGKNNAIQSYKLIDKSNNNTGGENVLALKKKDGVGFNRSVKNKTSKIVENCDDETESEDTDD